MNLDIITSTCSDNSFLQMQSEFLHKSEQSEQNDQYTKSSYINRKLSFYYWPNSAFKVYIFLRFSNESRATVLDITQDLSLDIASLQSDPIEIGVHFSHNTVHYHVLSRFCYWLKSKPIKHRASQDYAQDKLSPFLQSDTESSLKIIEQELQAYLDEYKILWLTDSEHLHKVLYFAQQFLSKNDLKHLQNTSNAQELFNLKNLSLSIIDSHLFDQEAEQDSTEDFKSTKESSERLALQELSSKLEIPLSKTETLHEVKTRIGQHLYRKKQEELWDGCCAVLGTSIKPLLRASHAKPWTQCTLGSERISPYNGFLLSAHLDALFDKYLISFSDDGQIIFASTLSAKELEELNCLGINQSLRLRKIYQEHLPFLAYHRNQMPKKSKS